MITTLRKLWQYVALTLVATSLCIACAQQPDDATADLEPLIVGNSPWPGFVAQYIAEEKGFYAEEGINVQEEFIQVSTDVNTALASDKLDIAWTGVPDMVVMANNEPALRLIAVSDYSDGADGILSTEALSGPQDLIGKVIAWEELPLQALLLQAYLEGSDVEMTDLDLRVMPAAEAATAFAAGRVDVAITFEPWITNAVKDGEGEMVFTSENTSLIAGGLVGKASVIESRREDIAAYFRALEKGFDFYESNREEAIGIVASKLELSSEELLPIMEKVRLFRPSEHQSVVFNADDKLNIIDSINFAAEVGKEMGIVNDSVDATTLYDMSYTENI